jgi:hypothetical protein
MHPFLGVQENEIARMGPLEVRDSAPNGPNPALELGPRASRPWGGRRHPDKAHLLKLPKNGIRLAIDEVCLQGFISPEIVATEGPVWLWLGWFAGR